MARIGIVGLGAMGLGIAQVYAQAGFDVIATDSFAVARANAKERLLAQLQPRVDAGKLDPQKMKTTLQELTIVEDIEGLAGADLVIEAIVEDLAIKQALLRNLENAAGPTTILATNTSALSVAKLAKGLRRPGQLLGLHFFNPAPVMRLVELIAHPSSDPKMLATARRWTESAGKTVISCADQPGFIVNRCARPFYGEALAMLEEGRSASEIDAAVLAAGYKMGPFGLIDLIGADINLAATEGLARAMNGHPRYHIFDRLREQVAKGDLGRKSGRGFLFPDAPGPAPSDASAIVLRIEVALANEAATLVEAGGAQADDIDVALRLGLNFPRGPFESARLHGKATVLAELARLAIAAPPLLTARYAVSPALAGLI